MKLYVIGKVTGIAHDNFFNFDRARRLLRAAGYEVEIPHDTIPDGTPWSAAMRLSIANMLACDGVATLKDWKDSPGALLEMQIACRVGIEVYPVWSWAARRKIRRHP